jgi:hypothetical protein
MVWIQLVDSNPNSLMIEIAWKLGLVAGAIYHFTCQCHRQVDVTTSLYAFSISNALFMVTSFLCERNSAIRTGLALVLFNTVYVLLFTTI